MLSAHPFPVSDESTPVLYHACPAATFVSVNVYEALTMMRRMSAEGKDFSFSFMSYNPTKGTSEGVVYVRRGILRKRETEARNRNAEYIEAYTDLETGEHRRFYQPLLMTFNGHKLILV